MHTLLKLISATLTTIIATHFILGFIVIWSVRFDLEWTHSYRIEHGLYKFPYIGCVSWGLEENNLVVAEKIVKCNR